MSPRRTDFIRAFIRTFSIQGSWNYRTLIGGGVGYALSPLIQRVYAGDPVALRGALVRHTREFNAHPYLAPVAIGALARLEHDGEDPETVARFKSALRAPLGALGDQVVWAGWRPLCTLLAAIAFLLGVGPIATVISYLFVYNVGHIGLRVWGFRVGWNCGKRVGATLKGVPLKRLAKPMVLVNQGLMGIVSALLIARIPGLEFQPVVIGLAVAVALGGYLVPRRVAGPAMAGLFLSCLVWLL